MKNRDNSNGQKTSSEEESNLEIPIGSLIEVLVSYFESRLKTNRDFLINLACILVATATGSRYYIMTDKGKLRLNLSVVIIGGSGISEKSIALNLVRKILQRISDKLGVELILPSQFTTEALTSMLAKVAKDGSLPTGIILSDEYTSMIKGASSKDYMAGALEFMAQLYDGHVENALTIRRGYEKIDEVYINFVGLTTFYFLTLLPEGFWSQGNGVRIIFVVDDERKYEPSTPEELAHFWSYSSEKEDEELENLAEQLAELHGDGDEIEVSFDPGAQEMINEFREECRKIAHEIFGADVFDTRANSLSRLTEFALKKSVIHAISRRKFQDGRPEVDAVDAKFGITEARKAFDAFLKIRILEEKVAKHPRNSPIEITQRTILGAFTKPVMSSKEISKSTGIHIATVQRTLRDLSREGAVEKIGSTKSAKWRIMNKLTSRSKRNAINE